MHALPAYSRFCSQTPQHGACWCPHQRPAAQWPMDEDERPLRGDTGKCRPDTSADMNTRPSVRVHRKAGCPWGSCLPCVGLELHRRRWRQREIWEGPLLASAFPRLPSRTGAPGAQADGTRSRWPCQRPRGLQTGNSADIGSCV